MTHSRSVLFTVPLLAALLPQVAVGGDPLEETLCRVIDDTARASIATLEQRLGEKLQRRRDLVELSQRMIDAAKTEIAWRDKRLHQHLTVALRGLIGNSARMRELILDRAGPSRPAEHETLTQAAVAVLRRAAATLSDEEHQEVFLALAPSARVGEIAYGSSEPGGESERISVTDDGRIVLKLRYKLFYKKSDTFLGAIVSFEIDLEDGSVATGIETTYDEEIEKIRSEISSIRRCAEESKNSVRGIFPREVRPWSPPPPWFDRMAPIQEPEGEGNSSGAGPAGQ